MATVTQDDVLSVLKRIAAPHGRRNVVSAGLLSHIAIQERLDGKAVEFVKDGAEL